MITFYSGKLISMKLDFSIFFVLIRDWIHGCIACKNENAVDNNEQI